MVSECPQWPSTALSMAKILLTMLSACSANLVGIGYREQVLQLPKGELFSSETPTGIPWASFSGGTTIFIQGDGFSENVQDNQVFLYSKELNRDIPSFPFSEDDVFRSTPMLGKLVYRLPAIHDLLGVPEQALDSYNTMTFELTVFTGTNEEKQNEVHKCGWKPYCTIQFQRAYSPIIYGLSPPVIYFQQQVQLWFDPRSTPNLIKNLVEEQLPFINFKINKRLVDFDEFVSFQTTFNAYLQNAVTGYVGDQPIGSTNDLAFLWEVGFSKLLQSQATHCSFDNSTCYVAKTVPVIFELSQNQGYITGGQILKVSGFGFNQGNISARVDGVECKVIDQTDFSFNCRMAETQSISQTGIPVVGGYGIKRTLVNASSLDMVSYSSIFDKNAQNHPQWKISESLSLHLESPYNIGNYYGTIFQGWFVPPTTGRYRFYMSCDDDCKIIFNNQTITTNNSVEILRVNRSTPRRDFWSVLPGGPRVSEWQSLTAGESYYLEVQHLEYTGNDHVSVAVEIEQSANRGHHHTMKQVQRVAILIENNLDTLMVNISNIDSGYFTLNFLNPLTNLYTASLPIKSSETNIYNIKYALSTYYGQILGTDTNISVLLYNSTGDLTTNVTAAITKTIIIQSSKLLPRVSASNILVAKTSTKSQIILQKPIDVQTSSPPLSGNFKIKCPLPDGFEQITASLPFSISAANLQWNLMQGCPFYMDKIEVWNSNEFSYSENGRGFLVRFVGVNDTVPQLQIINDESSPLTGNNLTFVSETIVPFGPNLFYEPVPFEFLRTFETKPQIQVSVNGQPAVCHNLTCDFKLVETDGEINSFQFDEGTRRLTIQGVNLPNDGNKIERIEFGMSNCTVDESSLSSTTINCILDNPPTCGSYLPLLISVLGKIPLTPSLSPKSISCTMTSGVPSTELNLLGEDEITISGTNLPRNLQSSNISLEFSDAAHTKCIPVKTSSTQLVCITSPFDPNSISQTYSLQVQINGQTVTNSLTFSLQSSIKSCLALSPSSASPVLKTKIQISLQSDFPLSLQRDDFSVKAISQSNSSYIRLMNVIQVDDAAKTLTVMFGGAYSGSYNIYVRHASIGLIKTSSLQLIVGSSITSITPLTGSIFGGSLLTITGTNFGTQITDNPVQISYNGGVGSTDCFLISSTATQIKCRIDTSISFSDGKRGDVVVFLKTSEEASCVAPSCAFSFTSSIPSVNALSTNFDSSLNQWTLVASGAQFSGDTSSVSVEIDGVPQTTLSVSNTQAVFRISNTTSGNLGPVKILFEIGQPTYNTNTTGLKVEPRLVSVTPNQGSVGGSVIIANIEGVGVNTQNLSLVDSSGTSICKSLVIVSYGRVECTTLEQVIASQQLRVKLGQSLYQCANTNSAECVYSQSSSNQMPVITALSLTDSKTLLIDGSNFFTSDYQPQVTIAGVKADQVVVNSNTQVTAIWNLGIPPLTTPTKPSLRFTRLVSSESHFASGSQTISNTLSISSSSQDVSCSFSGGCKYEITANGLSSLLQNPQSASITVCDERCVFDQQESTSSKSVCRLPALSTVYSNSNFQIKQPGVLKSNKYFGTSSNPEIAFDGIWVNTNADSSTDCSIGVEFRQGQVAILYILKFFLPDGDKSNLPGNLIFQGSNDGLTYTNIYTADALAHNGWNQIEFGDDKPLPYPKFRFYRFVGMKAGLCKINEIELQGIETVDDNNSQYQCTPALAIGGVKQSVTLSPVVYTATKTPKLNSIQPRYGSVTGGEEISFSGTGFSNVPTDVKITIDGIDCPVSSASVTLIKCITGKRPGLRNSTLEIYIQNKGSVSLQGKLFKYVNYWSSDTTWGGEFAPMEGESIYVPPGLNLLVDVDKTPEVNAVIVEGSLIFAPHPDPNHQRFFDAHYIFVNGGTMEVGTEEYPYTSKLTITMHGTISDPYLPTYGNKCIGIRQGNLNMIGQKREPTWTVLETTAEAGSNQITLQRAVDWQVGEYIAVAPSSFEGREAEQRQIIAVDRSNPDKPVLTLDSPFLYRHFAATENYGGVAIDMRSEVGLISRNIVYRGDESSVDAQYGAIIFLHSFGDDSVVANLAYTEFTRSGQAFKIGRYTVHFHMIGAVHKSYAKGNSVHQSFNRAFTIHGCQYLRLEENVVFDSMGHSIFIEDAVERYNFIYRNLVMMTKRSWSLLNTDQTPASFWLTNPNNDYIENHAAGSDRYSYWYDLKPHAIGASASLDVCPENEKVGRFENNHAHSNGRYGLRIFHRMVPRTYPCQPIQFDLTRPDNPFWKNPLITANFYNLTSWKNKRNGAIAERVGDVRFIGFKTVDNILAGIEFSLTDQVADNMASIHNATIVGMSQGNQELDLLLADPHGIITPRTENFTVKGVKFYNFNWNLSAALGSCSHCFHPAATDSGARTVTFSNLEFYNVTRKILYQEPWRAIYYDLDGSLTGKGPQSWATFYYNHHNVPECEHKEMEYNGVVCDNTIQMRRLAFWNWLPNGLFTGQNMYILPIDDNILNQFDASQKTAYYKNSSNYGLIPFKDLQDPKNAWAYPFVTGHKYKIHWGLTGLDYERMTIDLSERWRDTDKSIYLVHNFTDVRAKMDVNVNGLIYDNLSLPLGTSDLTEQSLKNGMNILFNDTATREFHFIINGKNSTPNWPNNRVTLTGIRCIGSCLGAIANATLETNVRLWSNPSSWPSGKLPAEGEDVEIEPGWNMVMDLNNTPVFRFVEINGRLTFKVGIDIQFNAKHIFIRAGELLIGNKTNPCLNNVVIKLYGEKNFQHMVYDNAVEAGNKLIANINILKIYGKPRVKNMVRLQESVFFGDLSLLVEPGLDLVSGDKLGLLPTSYVADQVDEVIVSSYDNSTGIVKLSNSTPIKFHHWGAAKSTADDYNGVDLRGEVLILTRNVKIIGEDIDGWGGQIVTSDAIDSDLSMRNGHTVLDSVEIYNCSQRDTFKSAIRFEGAVLANSSITNCAIHNGLGWAVNIKDSSNIYLRDNVIFSFRAIGLNVQGSRDITLDSNVLGFVYPREFGGIGVTIDKQAGMALCSYFYESGDKCYNIKVRNNIVGGVKYAGYIGYGHNCGDYTTRNFYNNTAHSVDGEKTGMGAWIFPDPTVPSQKYDCFEGSYFNAYKTKMFTAYFFMPAKKAIFSHMTGIEAGTGLGLQLTTPGTNFGEQGVVPDEYLEYVAQLDDNTIYGETPLLDCPQKVRPGDFCNLMNKFGIMAGAGSVHKKEPHITADTKLPPNKVKQEMTWGMKALWNRNKFVNFKLKTASGMKISAIGSSHYHMDYVPIQWMQDTVFENVEFEAVAQLLDPDRAWAVIDDCGNFPCTMPMNLMFHFKNTQWIGIKPFQGVADFQIIGNNSGFAPFVDSCQYQVYWNAYYCTNQDLGLLLFESQDVDRFTRAVQPVYLKQQGTGMSNTLNAYMDHVWDGFYTGQTRLTRFPALVVTPRGSVYDITYTGTPPKTQLFELIHYKKTAGMTIRIAYPDAISQQVKVNGENIDMNQWDKTINQYGEIKQRFCGENRYIGVKNILEFYITQGCRVYLSPRNAIQTQVRMEWSLESFYAKGGTTTLADRICGVLGIHASQLKIVSIYEGSLVLNYELTSDDGSSSGLDAIEKQQTQLFATGQMDLGAPILDVQSSRLSSSTQSSSSKTTSIVKDGVVTAAGFEPIKITITPTNQHTQSSNQFNPTISISQETKTIINTQTIQETIINKTPNVNSNVQIVEEKTASDSKFPIIVSIIGSFALISLVGISLRYLYMKKMKAQIELEAVIRRQRESVRQLENTDQKIIQDGDQIELEVQYDPANDFNIFMQDNPRDSVQKNEVCEIQEVSQDESMQNSQTKKLSSSKEMSVTEDKLKTCLEEDNEMIEEE